MAFQTACSTYERDSGEICDYRIKVACMTWTTAGNLIIPLFFKMIDGDGELKTIKPVKVIGYGEKIYNSERCLEYECSAEVQNSQKRFRLLYFVEQTRGNVSSVASLSSLRYTI